MIKKYEVQDLIIQVLESLNNEMSKPNEDGVCTAFDARASIDSTGDIIFTFKEDYNSTERPDKYRIRVTYCED